MAQSLGQGKHTHQETVRVFSSPSLPHRPNCGALGACSTVLSTGTRSTMPSTGTYSAAYRDMQPLCTAYRDMQHRAVYRDTQHRAVYRDIQCCLQGHAAPCCLQGHAAPCCLQGHAAPCCLQGHAAPCWPTAVGFGCWLLPLYPNSSCIIIETYFTILQYSNALGCLVERTVPPLRGKF